MKIQYIRLHTLTGQSQTCDFSVNTDGWTVSKFEEIIEEWNKQGFIDGVQVWHYRLTVKL